MENIILILILVLVLGFATAYIVKSKKQGVKCVGCPYAKDCANKSSCCDIKSK